MKGDSYLLIAIMVTMLVVIGLTLRMEYFALKLVPMTISSLVFILGVIRLSRERLVRNNGKATLTGDETPVEDSGEDWRAYLVGGAWLVGFVLAIYLLGFLVAIPLLIVCYMKSHGTGWLATIFAGIVTPALIYGIFGLVLKVDVYRGLLFG